MVNQRVCRGFNLLKVRDRQVMHTKEEIYSAVIAAQRYLVVRKRCSRSAGAAWPADAHYLLRFSENNQLEVMSDNEAAKLVDPLGKNIWRESKKFNFIVSQNLFLMHVAKY